MQGIPVNIPRLILDQICASNLATSPKGLPFGMMFTRLFSLWGVPLAGQEPIAPSRPLDSSFISRKQSHRASFATSEEDTPHEPSSSSSAPASSSYVSPSFIESFEGTLSHFAAAIRYQHDVSFEIARHMQLDLPTPSLQSHPLPFEGPPFAPWVPPRPYPSTSEAYEGNEDAE